jgi:hypothetical protein
MNELDKLIEKLLRVEALRSGATTAGERDAAEAARQRLMDRIGGLPVDQTRADQSLADEYTEWKFSLADLWSRRLFLALCRKHGLQPYRRYRQRRTTVLLKATDKQVNDVLWPEYLAISEQLQMFLSDVTDRVIKDVLKQDTTDDANEVPELE